MVIPKLSKTMCLWLLETILSYNGWNHCLPQSSILSIPITVLFFSYIVLITHITKVITTTIKTTCILNIILSCRKNTIGYSKSCKTNR